MAKHTKTIANANIEDIKTNLVALGLTDFGIAQTLDEIKDRAAFAKTNKLKKPKKLTEREKALQRLDADNDAIQDVSDSMLYILMHTATCHKFGFDLPFSELFDSTKDSQRLDDFQFCVSALEHAANPNLIKNADRIRIYEYAPDTSCSDKLNDAMMKAILEPCKARVLELLSGINTSELNVGTEQDIIDFKSRVGIK